MPFRSDDCVCRTPLEQANERDYVTRMDVQIAIEEAYAPSARFGKGFAEGSSLPSVCAQRDDANVWNRLGGRFRQCTRVVRRAVINDKDLERSVELAADRIHSLRDTPSKNPRFVMTRKENGQIDGPLPDSACLISHVGPIGRLSRLLRGRPQPASAANRQ